MLRQSSVPGGLAAVTKDGKGVAVVACQRDGDVGVFWGHRGGSSGRSQRHQACVARIVQLSFSGLREKIDKPEPDRAVRRNRPAS